MLGGMCITTILFKWQHAVGKIISYSIYILGLKRQNSNFLRILVYEYSWRRAREDNARRQAWSQLFLGDGKYVVVVLLRVDGH